MKSINYLFLLGGLLLVLVVLLSACTKDEGEKDGHNPIEDKQEVVTDEIDETEEEEISEMTPLEKDITFGGKVFVEDKSIRVLGESNLAEGTLVAGNLYSSPFSEVRDTTTLVTGEEATVDETGKFEIEFPFEKYSDMDFLERFNGSILEVELEVEMGYSQSDEIRELYGERGENLKGPIVYTKKSFGELHQYLYLPTYVRIGSGQSEYEIKVPERSPLPADYGEPNVRIDIEEVTHDHEFFYVKGKSNLIAGTFLRGGYHSSEISKFPQSFYHNTTHVQPDGSFTFRAEYHTLAKDGFIRITAKSVDLHLASNLLYDAYGEEFERIEGEYVTYDELDKKNKIEIIHYPSIPEIEVPEETNVTENNGEIKIQVPDDVLFNADKTDIKPDAEETLAEIIELLEKLEEGTTIQINGHTDSEGNNEDNAILSENKALAVESHLIGNGNLDHLEITTKGYGEEKPLASNEQEEGRERNRRVEIVINPVR